MSQIMAGPTRLLYCNCTYAQVVPKDVKAAVLKRLCESGVAFEAVADLCEMSARQDAALQRLAEGGSIKIAACYPRAVKWLFAAARAPLPQDSTEVLNMRVQTAEDVVNAILNSEIKPNLPSGKPAAPVASSSESEISNLNSQIPAGDPESSNSLHPVADSALRTPHSTLAT
jgi:hypothetical protein